MSDFDELLMLAQTGDAGAIAVLSDWMLQNGAREAAVRQFLWYQLGPDLPPARYYDTVGLSPDAGATGVLAPDGWRFQCCFAGEPVSVGTTLELFRDLSNKRDSETNLRQPRRLPSGVRFTLERVRVDARGMTPEFAAAAVLRLRVNDTPWCVVPLRVLLDAGLNGVPSGALQHKPPLVDDDDLAGLITVQHPGVVLTAPLDVTVYLEGTEMQPEGQ